MSTSATCCDLILFGTLGDLARRKLIPALYQLEKSNLLHDDSRIIGVGREQKTTSEYRTWVQEQLGQFVTKEQIDGAIWQRFAGKLHYQTMDLTQIQSYQSLRELTDPETRVPVSYFATSPSLFASVCEGLASIGLNQGKARVVLEKPLGHDLESSVEINQQVAERFNESQIYRIDHYLGKETVLNLLALRFANSLFTDQWSHDRIEHIQITAAEQVGVEGRWGYYDDAGQLRDMVQNHLLQVLSLIAMEPPMQLDAMSIRAEKLKVLKSLRPINAENVADDTVRGQYAAGFIGEDKVPGYLQEEGAAERSTTETFVALKAHIDNWRWSGVPFYLRTGKRMPQKRTEVVITFKPQAHNIFHETLHKLPPNRLIIRLQPDEGVEIEMMNKVPGLGQRMQLQPATLNLSFFQAFDNKRIADAYERLLLEAMEGNQYLFVHRDEVEYAWQWIDGIRNAWASKGDYPKSYQAGTWGPAASVTMLAQDGREWDDEI